jgi:hypothetical protein
LRVEVIDRFDDLAPLRRDWDDVYDSDPEASFFLSWTWMSHWLRTFRRDWFVLAARRDAGAPAFDAFWPLGLSTQHSPREGFRTMIDMAGNRHATTPVSSAGRAWRTKHSALSPIISAR